MCGLSEADFVVLAFVFEYVCVPAVSALSPQARLSDTENSGTSRIQQLEVQLAQLSTDLQQAKAALSEHTALRDKEVRHAHTSTHTQRLACA